MHFAGNLGGLAGWGANGDWTFMGLLAGLFAVDSFFFLRQGYYHYAV